MRRPFYIIKKLVSNILSRPLSVLGTLLSLFLLFLLFNLVWITSRTATQFYDGLISEIEIEVFLEDTIPDSTVSVIREAIAGLDGVDTIEFISRETARDRLTGLMGVDLLEGLEGNPLPRSLLITFEPNYLNSDNLDWLSRDLQRMAGVTEILYPSRWLENAEFTKSLISDILTILGVVVAVAAILYLIHVIMLSARTRMEELIQMQLLGAGQIFLALPYIMEGIFYALAASVAGWLIINYGITFVSFRDIRIILPESVEIVYFCLVASAIGMVGGYLGIRREL